MRRIFMLAPLLVICLASGSAAAAEAAQTFRTFASDYLAAYFTIHPVRATQLGIHEQDGRLPDLSAAAIRKRVKQLRSYLRLLLEIDRQLLDVEASLDHRVLEHAIRAELLELEEVRGWRHNPMLYNRLMAEGTASLIDREFAPLAARLVSLTSRLNGYAELVRNARKNLKDVPAAWTELAIKNTRGHVEFLREDVPRALATQGLGEIGAASRARWALARRAALAEIESFLAWLQRDLAPRSSGDFRLGTDVLQRKLLYEEHVTTGVDELNELNEQAIREYGAWVLREAARIDADRPVAEVMAEITSRHPAPDELIATARRNVEQARQFIRAHGIVTLPTDELPVVRPTPEYARSGFASMSTPGPFESNATDAYYNITLVDPDWSARQEAEHLTYFNYPGLLGVSIHEVMPGHFVQLLYRRQVPTDLRKVFMPASLIEGWAHYTEQMMIDEGFGASIRGVRLGQLRRALQRHARWHVGMAMHVSGASILESAIEFADIAYFAEFPALRETQRGTYNPTFLYYALGRMEILRLREDYRTYLEARGETFGLREFHDAVLRLGLPIPLIRDVLMPAEE